MIFLGLRGRYNGWTPAPLNRVRTVQLSTPCKEWYANKLRGAKRENNTPAPQSNNTLSHISKNSPKVEVNKINSWMLYVPKL